jgi:hypothetical protein
MTSKTVSRTSLVCLAGICVGLASCESSKGREAAVQFAFSWEQTIKVLGFGYMSDIREVEKHSRLIERESESLRANASASTQREARQLNALILYVARCLSLNIKDNVARPQSSELLPVNFPDAALNQLLGLDSKDGDASAEKSIAALHAAIVRFAEKVGVGSDYKDALKRREESDARQGPQKKSGPEPTWAQVRELKLRAAQTIRTALAAERDKVETQARQAKAPSGFGPVKWLMYPEEVKKACPKAISDSEGNLVEKTEWLGRAAEIEYRFENGFLVTIRVSFEDKGSETSFAATEQSLRTNYAMSTPKETDEFALQSTYAMGVQGSHVVRFSVLHVLGKSSSRFEWVYFSREDFI